MSSTILALIGMCCWGIAPVFAKLGLRNIDPLTGLCVRTMLASILVSGWVVVVNRAQHFTVVPLKAIILITVEAILATVVGDLAYYAAMRKGACAETSVILSASPAVTIALSILLLSERPSPISLVGAALITVGLILVGTNVRP